MILTFSSGLLVRAQIEVAARGSLDRYGDIACDDAMARLDNFATALTDAPNSQAYVLVYDGVVKLPGRVLSHMNFTKGHLTNTRGIEEHRIKVVFGGQRQELTVELFVVPKGAAPPIPMPTTEAKGVSRISHKFDEGFVSVYKGRTGRAELVTYELCPLGSPDIAEYAKTLRESQTSMAHIIIYSRYNQRYSEIKTISKLLRRSLVTEERIETQRISIMHGGRREASFLELWLVPNGAAPPKPSPLRKK